MVSWKSGELKAPEIRPSSTPRAAPSRPKETTANQRRQLKTPSGSPRSFRRKTLTGFLTPPAIVIDLIAHTKVRWEEVVGGWKEHERVQRYQGSTWT